MNTKSEELNKLELLEQRVKQLELFVKRHDVRESITRMVINNMYGKYPAKDSKLYYQKIIEEAMDRVDRDFGYTPIQITIDDLGENGNGK